MFSSNVSICLAAKIYCSRLTKFPQLPFDQPSISTAQAFFQKAQNSESQPKVVVNNSAQIHIPIRIGRSHADSTSIVNVSSNPVQPLPPSPELPPRTSAEFLLAAPQNLNPGLAPPPPPPPEVLPATPSEAPDREANTSQPLSVTLESIDLNLQDESSKFGQSNRIVEPTFNFNVNDEFSIAVTTGFDFFNQPDLESVSNVPIQLTWQDKFGDLKVSAGGGVDLFDRLSPQPNFNVSVIIPVLPDVTLTPALEYGAYKFNSETLENQITTLRFNTSLYWQIDSQTSLFSLFRLGVYNDGNFEQQSFSRLEHRIDNFSLALNLFNWVYRENLELQSGYFAPNDFIVYNGEIAWKDQLFDFLNCRVATSLGRGRLQGNWTTSSSIQGLCTVQISPDISLDLGYNFSNVRDRLTGGSAFNNQTITGELNIKL